MTCPNCTYDCNQGRDCPNRIRRRFSLGWLWSLLKGGA